MELGVRGITCDSKGNVYTVESTHQNNSLLIFTEEGKFLQRFDIIRPSSCGDYAYKRGRVRDPHISMAIDTNKNLYVMEEDRVSVFTLEGKFRTSFSVKVEPPSLEMQEHTHKRSFTSHQRDLAVDSYGIVYVCDPLKNYIHLY